MKSKQAEELRSINTLTQLIKFLRDELDWPIDSDDVEEYTYEYTAEELGIEGKHLPKIKEIKQLRPLDSRQPWGIFWVNFEKKQLPVVVLRRILGGLVLKKRTDPKKSGRPAWHLNDLLFISSYGESEHRVTSFAHFAERPEGDDLPALKVLGWDDRDSKLHMDQVVTLMQEYLRWPGDPENRKEWREQWSRAFTLRHREVITTSKELSIRLAELARAIRDRIKAVLAVETDRGRVTSLMKAFREALIHDLDEDSFADMYAQTIAYGLLSARITDPKSKSADDLALHMKTNPFLKELMGTFLKAGGRRGGKSAPGIDFDELGVGEVIDLLDDANMEAVIRDFGDRNPQEDPVIHFYELFLKEYDAKKRMQRGVFYTPRPVVSYIVRSVDELLRTEFGLDDGLADTTTWGELAKRHMDLKIPKGVLPDQDFVQVLDPATGTGTFLVEVIDLIYKTLVDKWKAQGNGKKEIDTLWNEYVPKHLLTRLHGYELLMAPYAIAHLKIGLKLYETGYRFGSDARARVYMTNALEPAGDGQLTLDFLPALAHEAQAVNTIKEKKRFTVVIGNPPYSNLSANLTPDARALVEPFKFIKGERIRERGALSLEKNLNDDYVKFVRLAQLTLHGMGVAALVTNSGFMGNPTLRGMRWSLLESYSRFVVLNLLGYAGASTRTMGDIKDENVFDIANAGIAIHIGISGLISANRLARYAEVIGSRETKYAFLTKRSVYTTEFVALSPTPPFFLLEPTDAVAENEYEQGVPLLSLFKVNSTGIRTLRDGFVVSFDADPLIERVTRFRDSKLSDVALCTELNLEMPGWWNVAVSRKSIAKEKDLKLCLKQLSYRPFDVRRIFYHESLVGSPRRPVMQHMEPRVKNLALHICRQLSSPRWEHVLVTRGLTDDCYVSNRTKERGYTIPLYLQAEVGHLALSGVQSNCDIRPFQTALHSQDASQVNAEIVFGYVYAILFSPIFRIRYLDFLKRDFPRLPLTENLVFFRDLARLGNELVALHLLESPKVDRFITEYIGGRAPEVEKVSWSNNTVWVDKAQTIGFKGVREEVWNFHIGGYQVCEKWLKNRKGRKLLKADIEHYQKIVVALSETIKIMKKIDEVIEQHGGWPGAFITGEKYEAKEGLGLEKVAEKGKSPGKRKAGKKGSDDPENVVEDMF